MMSTSRLRCCRCQHAGVFTAAITTVLKPAGHELLAHSTARVWLSQQDTATGHVSLHRVGSARRTTTYMIAYAAPKSTHN